MEYAIFDAMYVFNRVCVCVFEKTVSDLSNGVNETNTAHFENDNQLRCFCGPFSTGVSRLSGSLRFSSVDVWCLLGV